LSQTSAEPDKTASFFYKATGNDSIIIFAERFKGLFWSTKPGPFPDCVVMQAVY